jgi:hypothetical protein
VEPGADPAAGVPGTGALAVLGMKRGACFCAYSDGKKSEWDHSRAVVKDRKPTGYITEIANLVPACGKCNHSRGNKDWKTWILGPAAQSPTTRRIQDVPARIRRLEAFALWSMPVCINHAELAEEDHWTLHTTNLERVLTLLEEAEAHAMKLGDLAAVEARRQRGDA